MTEPERIQTLNTTAVCARGDYVLYWMQQSQRAACNPALEYAVAQANLHQRPVVVVFALMAGYPEANARHFAFMLQGLVQVSTALSRRGIRFVLRQGEPVEVVLALARRAVLVVCDRGYLRHQRAWRKALAASARCAVVQVEGDVVVPVEQVSQRKEYAARTIRRKVLAHRDGYLRLPSATPVKVRADAVNLDTAADLDLRHPQVVLNSLDIDHSVAPVTRFRGGLIAARKLLRDFLQRALIDYAADRNDPADPRCSYLSAYLHFGQISPVELAVKVAAAQNCAPADREAFLEQLVVRRELAINYVLYEPHYDRYAGIPDWARRSLAKHAGDERPVRYTRRQLETAQTHDRYWNAAMQEMRKSGFMHNYMRMYWGK